MTSIFSKEQFLQFQAAFKSRANAGLNDSADMVLYNIARGKTTECGFTPITNKNKLHNGASAWFGLSYAKSCVLVRVYKTHWDHSSMKKIWDPSYLKSTYGIDTTEDQLKSIAAAAGWNV